MKPLLLIKILNLMNGLLVIIFMLKLLHVFSFLRPFSILQIALAALLIYGLKSWLEVRYEIGDPIRENKLTNMLFYLGLGLTALGVLIKVMHWPYQEIFFLTGGISICAASFISFFVEPSKRETNNEILDDID